MYALNRCLNYIYFRGLLIGNNNCAFFVFLFFLTAKFSDTQLYSDETSTYFFSVELCCCQNRSMYFVALCMFSGGANVKLRREEKHDFYILFKTCFYHFISLERLGNSYWIQAKCLMVLAFTPLL